VSKLKNKKSLYWGGNENTMIPRMSACGEGIGVESGVDPGSGTGAQGPTATASAPDGPGLFDKLKGLLPSLALGALVLAAVAGVVFMLKKNRDGDPNDSWDDSLPDTENYEKLGLDVEGARPVNRAATMEQNGYNEDGLPIPPDFVGQQIIDEDGNLWIYKDPPGAWINFGDTEPRYNSSGVDIEVPVYESYFGNIIDVVDDTHIVTDESWSSMGEVVGNVVNEMPSLFTSWKILYPHQTVNKCINLLDFQYKEFSMK